MRAEPPAGSLSADISAVVVPAPKGAWAAPLLSLGMRPPTCDTPGSVRSLMAGARTGIVTDCVPKRFTKAVVAERAVAGYRPCVARCGGGGARCHIVAGGPVRVDLRWGSELKRRLRTRPPFPCEVRELRRDNEILKGASTFFARERVPRTSRKTDGVDRSR